MTGILIFVRMNSKRLFGKALRDFSGKPCLYWLCRQLYPLSYRGIQTVVCTSDNPLDDAIHDFCAKEEIECFRGSEMDVLGRMWGAIQHYGFDKVVRVTGDDIFVDPAYIELALQLCTAQFAYTDMPKGSDFQIISAELVKNLFERNTRKDTEYLTWYFNSASDRQLLKISPAGSPAQSFELDTEIDAENVDFAIQNLKHAPIFRIEDLLQFAKLHPGRFPIKDTVDNRTEEIDAAGC